MRVTQHLLPLRGFGQKLLPVAIVVLELASAGVAWAQDAHKQVLVLYSTGGIPSSPPSASASCRESSTTASGGSSTTTRSSSTMQGSLTLRTTSGFVIFWA